MLFCWLLYHNAPICVGYVRNVPEYEWDAEIGMPDMTHTIKKLFSMTNSHHIPKSRCVLNYHFSNEELSKFWIDIFQLVALI